MAGRCGGPCAGRWMRSLALLLALPAWGQLATFVPTGESVGPFQRYSLTVCNPGPVNAPVTGAWILAESMRQGVQLATAVAVQRAADRDSTRSWQRTALLGIEIAGYLTTALTATDLVSIKERRYKGIVAAVPGVLRFATTVIKQAPFSLPADLWPPGTTQLPPGECSSWSAFGAPFQRGRP